MRKRGFAPNDSTLLSSYCHTTINKLFIRTKQQKINAFQTKLSQIIPLLLLPPEEIRRAFPEILPVAFGEIGRGRKPDLIRYFGNGQVG